MSPPIASTHARPTPTPRQAREPSGGAALMLPLPLTLPLPLPQAREPVGGAEGGANRDVHSQATARAR
eukprot:scaffold98449_cov27-Phaeocystis_antarctica.AAC.1